MRLRLAQVLQRGARASHEDRRTYAQSKIAFATAGDHCPNLLAVLVVPLDKGFQFLHFGTAYVDPLVRRSHRVCGRHTAELAIKVKGRG
jgi:hypothetical protein